MDGFLPSVLSSVDLSSSFSAFSVSFIVVFSGLILNDIGH